MENASKALLITAGVFLAIMVISIGVYLAGNLRNTSDTYVATMDNSEIQKFNSKFLNYEGRTDITAQEVATVISNVVEESLNIKVYLNDEEVDWSTNIENSRNEFIFDNITSQYECTEITYDANGKINEIKFKQIREIC